MKISVSRYGTTDLISKNNRNLQNSASSSKNEKILLNNKNLITELPYVTEYNLKIHYITYKYIKLKFYYNIKINLT